jgi:hypothetical protein
MPMHTRSPHNIIQTLQFPHNERAMGPRTRIRDIEMIATLFRRKLGVGRILDVVPEGGLLALEFAGWVAGGDPVRY